MENQIDVFEDDIDVYLQEYIDSREIQDPRKITSSMWAAAMMFINAHVFKNRDILRQTHTYNNNPYDLDKVLRLLDKYIFLCNDHNQRICVEHFCLLSGITKATISYWTNDLRRSGDKKAKQIVTKLMEHSLMAADDLMVSKTGVNSIAYANNIRDRYSTFMEKQKDSKAIDMADVAEQLGITRQLTALSAPRKPVNNISLEVLGVDADVDDMDWKGMSDNEQTIDL